MHDSKRFSVSRSFRSSARSSTALFGRAPRPQGACTRGCGLGRRWRSCVAIADASRACSAPASRCEHASLAYTAYNWFSLSFGGPR